MAEAAVADGRVNREGYFVGVTSRQCTKCNSLFQITSAMTLCKPCNSTRVKSQSPEWKMVQRAKRRALVSGLDFDISLEDIVIPDACPILGIPLNMNSGRPGAFKNSPSLDRKDNSKGYTKDNVWVISQQANAMKGASNNCELKRFAEWAIMYVSSNTAPDKFI